MVRSGVEADAEDLGGDESTAAAAAQRGEQNIERGDGGDLAGQERVALGQ
jgi:hypothetical protein